MTSEFRLASQRDDITWNKNDNAGASSPNFSGGKYVDDKGYVRVLMPEHPRNIRGYVYEHRLIMENYLCRHLQPWETVHHINEIKIDNRMENFFLCTHKEHSALHMEGRKPTMKQKDLSRESIKDIKPHTKKKHFYKKTI